MMPNTRSKKFLLVRTIHLKKNRLLLEVGLRIFGGFEETPEENIANLASIYFSKQVFSRPSYATYFAHIRNRFQSTDLTLFLCCTVYIEIGWELFELSWADGCLIFDTWDGGKLFSAIQRILSGIINWWVYKDWKCLMTFISKSNYHFDSLKELI